MTCVEPSEKVTVTLATVGATGDGVCAAMYACKSDTTWFTAVGAFSSDVKSMACNSESMSDKFFMLFCEMFLRPLTEHRASAREPQATGKGKGRDEPTQAHLETSPAAGGPRGSREN